MRKRWRSALAGIALAATASASSAPAQGASSDGAAAGRARGVVPICLAANAIPGTEHTAHVPSFLVDTLLQVTASYRGPCAAYGESAPRGSGTLTAYSQQERGKPFAIGVVLPDRTLTGLPLDPPTDGTSCFDKDGNGSIDPMVECANGYGSILRLSSGFRHGVDTPFKYLMVDWNPHGHGPPNVYDKPHFDAHFYLQDDAERRAIRPARARSW